MGAGAGSGESTCHPPLGKPKEFRLYLSAAASRPGVWQGHSVPGAEGLPLHPPIPPAWTSCPPQSQSRSRQQMSLSHSALLFHTIAPRKSNPPQVGRVKINAWWKVPRGKLIGSPGRFFNHNRLWRPPGLRVFAQGSRLAGGGWGCVSLRAHPRPSRGPMPAGALLGWGTE